MSDKHLQLIKKIVDSMYKDPNRNWNKHYFSEVELTLGEELDLEEIRSILRFI